MGALRRVRARAPFRSTPPKRLLGFLLSLNLLSELGDLLRFLDENFPSKEDLAHPCDPRSHKGALIEKLLRMTNLYKRRRQRVEDDQEG